jgi:hypothetical protein
MNGDTNLLERDPHPPYSVAIPPSQFQGRINGEHGRTKWGVSPHPLSPLGGGR